LKPRKPYLLRAMHEWISESDCTPHLVVDAGVTGVDVPRQFVRDGKIILNISWTATAGLRMDADRVSFSGRFGGSAMNVRVPMEAVLAIYARETGQGMIFGEEDGVSPPPATTPETTSDTKPEPPSKPPSGGARARLKVVK
jgi:stringent starvation protein B